MRAIRKLPVAPIGRSDFNPKSVVYPAVPRSIRGALRDRHECRARDAMDALVAAGRATSMRTAKSCGPGAPWLALNLLIPDVGPVGPDMLRSAGDGD